MELTDDEVTLVERILNPDNLATKKYLSDKQVDIINFESPIKQSMLSDAVEFFNRRDGLDSSEFNYVVHEEDRDDRIINKIFEKMRFQGLTGVSYDKMYRTLKFIPKDCYEKILQTSIILKDMRLDDVVRYWQARAYIPNKPYIIITEKGSSIMHVRPGEYMLHSGGSWSFAETVSGVLEGDDTEWIHLDCIRYFSDGPKTKMQEERLSDSVGLYLNWLSFASRLAVSSFTSFVQLYNNPKSIITSWAKYFKYTCNINSVISKSVEDIVEEVYKLSNDEEFKVNFHEIRKDGYISYYSNKAVKKCVDYLEQKYPKNW